MAAAFAALNWDNVLRTALEARLAWVISPPTRNGGGGGGGRGLRSWGLQSFGDPQRAAIVDVRPTPTGPALLVADLPAGLGIVPLATQRAGFQPFHCEQARAILLERDPITRDYWGQDVRTKFLPGATYIFQYPEPTEQPLATCMAVAQIRIECFAARLPKRSLWEDIGKGNGQHNLLQAVQAGQGQSYVQCMNELRLIDELPLVVAEGDASITLAEWCGYNIRVQHFAAGAEPYVAFLQGGLGRGTAPAGCRCPTGASRQQRWTASSACRAHACRGC